MSGKREKYLTWDEYYISMIALTSLAKSLNESACLVDHNHRMLSIASAGVPYSYSRYSSEYQKSAIFNARYSYTGDITNIENGTIYLSTYPSYMDAKILAQSRIKEIIYLLPNEKYETSREVTEKILDCARIQIKPYFDEAYSKRDYGIFLEGLKRVLKSYISKEPVSNLNRDEYYMGISLLSALRSKDPSTQVGACLVDAQSKVVSVGYNGAPYGMSDDIFPWDSKGEVVGNLLEDKGSFVVHAEVNAVDNCRYQPDIFQNAKLYLTLSPCFECASRIDLLPLREIIYLRDYPRLPISEVKKVWLRNIICTPYDSCYISYSKAEYRELVNALTEVIKSNIGKSYENDKVLKIEKRKVIL